MPTPKKYDSAAEKQAAYRQRREEARRAAMEAKNLPAPAAIPTMPSLARWKGLQEQAQACLQTMLDEMQGYYDERSEQWQEGERGEAFQELLDQVDAVRASAEEIALG